jgi:hypothetical protein
MNPLELPQLREWIGKDGEFDPRGFVLANITVAEAKSLSMLLWPEFVEYRGHVFLKFLFDEQGVEAWIAKLGDDRKAVESVVNHLHLWDVFAPGSEEERRAVSALCSDMAEMWRAAVSRYFPGRDFLVTLADEPDEYGPTLVLASG